MHIVNANRVQSVAVSIKQQSGVSVCQPIAFFSNVSAVIQCPAPTRPAFVSSLLSEGRHSCLFRTILERETEAPNGVSRLWTVELARSCASHPPTRRGSLAAAVTRQGQREIYRGVERTWHVCVECAAAGSELLRFFHIGCGAVRCVTVRRGAVRCAASCKDACQRSLCGVMHGTRCVRCRAPRHTAYVGILLQVRRHARHCAAPHNAPQRTVTHPPMTEALV